MSSIEDVVDQRFAVVIVWAIFFFVFIIFPSLCIRCLGCCFGTSHAAAAAGMDGMFRDDDSYIGGWDRYMFLSASRRARIDELRTQVLRQYLAEFSISLKESDMITTEDGSGNIGQGGGKSDEEEKEEGKAEELKSSDCQITSREMTCTNDHIDREEGNGNPTHVEDATTEDASAKRGNDRSKSIASEKVGLVDIVAPPGNLQMIFEHTSSNDGLSPSADSSTTNSSPNPKTQVMDVSPESPIYGKIQVGDKIISVDDYDMTSMPLTVIYIMLMEKEKCERKITVFRGDYAGFSWGEMEGDADSDYTHVTIPHPGYDNRGRKVEEVEESDSTMNGGASNWRMLNFLSKKQDYVDSSNAEIDSKDKTTKLPEKAEQQHGESGDPHTNDRRTIPAFCAICLGSYSPNETITWSSNDECTHVFHNECIVHWLHTLGKKTAKYQRFSNVEDNPPSAKQLLNYRLECPCCRQSFVNKALILEDGRREEGADSQEPVSGDENV